jgi:hypothetical protein
METRRRLDPRAAAGLAVWRMARGVTAAAGIVTPGSAGKRENEIFRTSLEAGRDGALRVSVGAHGRLGPGSGEAIALRRAGREGTLAPKVQVLLVAPGDAPRPPAGGRRRLRGGCGPLKKAIETQSRRKQDARADNGIFRTPILGTCPRVDGLARAGARALPLAGPANPNARSAFPDPAGRADGALAGSPAASARWRRHSLATLGILSASCRAGAVGRRPGPRRYPAHMATYQTRERPKRTRGSSIAHARRCGGPAGLPVLDEGPNARRYKR